MIADDLFAGAGGWDLAAHQLGIEARGVEKMPQARATREAAGLSTIHDDVWTYAPDGRAAMMLASPPCQTFSKAGGQAGRKALDDVLRGIRDGYVEDLDHLRFLGLEVGDERTALVLTPLHFARHYDTLAWEQVPGVLPVWEACAAYLQARGWHTWTGVLHAEEYGVGQARRRAVLLASKRGPVFRPTSTHSRFYPRTPTKLDPGVKKWVSMAEALALPAQGRPEALRMTKMPNSAVRSVDHPAPTIMFGNDPNQCRWLYREDLPAWCHERPATTVVGTYSPDVLAAPGYRLTTSRQDTPDSVRITVAEAATLQSFPTGFPWQGAKTKQYLQVGNAIPPLLAGACLEATLTGVRP